MPSSSNKQALKVFRQEIRDKYPNATKEEQKQIYKALKGDFLKELESQKSDTKDYYE